MQVQELSPSDIPITHYHSHKVYGRRMDLKAGQAVMGKIHKYESMLAILGGDVTVAFHDGQTKRITGGDCFVCPAGTQRAFLAHADTSVVVYHGTEERDVALIEAEFIAQTPEEYQLFLNQKETPCLG
jgi:quercetin dioxygenase-like cupin family protein